MNPRLELYRSGAGLTVATVYARRGVRSTVIDPARRRRAIAAAAASKGLSLREVATLVGCSPAAVVSMIGADAPKFRAGWKITNKKY